MRPPPTCRGARCHPCAALLLFQSKGGILSKACEYIKELRQSNLKLGEDLGSLDRVRVDNQLLRQEVALQRPLWWSPALQPNTNQALLPR